VALRPFVPGSGYFRQWAVMIERKRAVRTKVFLAAQIRTARRPPLVIDCVVRDVSPLGARLELRDTSTLPNIFELTFDSGRTLRACHVVWRTPTDVGVEFSPGLQQPTNDDTAWTGNRSILNCYFSLNSKKQFSPHFFTKTMLSGEAGIANRD
jgi:PilZ domain